MTRSAQPEGREPLATAGCPRAKSCRDRPLRVGCRRDPPRDRRRRGEAGRPPPPAKDLAAVLGVNANTVLRVLRLLRDEGILEFRRGRGISVAGSPERGAVVQQARELVVFARRNGYRLDELLEIIEGIA
jgi:GntR family transcriptional regulator